MNRHRRIMRRVQVLSVTFIALVAVSPVGVALASAVVAIDIVRKRTDLIAFTLPVAAMAGIFGPSWGGVVILPVSALVIGAVVGQSIIARRGWWRIVLYAGTLLFAGQLIMLAGMRDIVAGAAQEVIPEGPDAEQFNALQQQYLAMFEWWFDHWNETFAGIAFVNALFSAVLVTALTVWRLKVTGTPVKVAGSFKTMRVPDGIAWVLIATAALWYADQQYPAEWMRILSWNTGLALLGLYWLNGLTIAAYAVAAFKPNPLMLAALFVAAALLNLMPLLVIPGLFDTWADFRRKFNNVLAARELRENSRDDSI